MSNNVQKINKLNAGLCPHGLPPGACPVCSTSGGGTLRMSDKNRKIGEMTYHECAMIGNMMRARELAQKRHDENLQIRLLNVKSFRESIENAIVKMNNFMNFISQKPIFKPIVLLARVISFPIIKMAQFIPKMFQNLGNFKFEISDKLAAIFGEAKAFTEKKVSDFVQVINSKLETLFRIFKKKNADDDDTKIDADKKIFNLKIVLQKIIKKMKKKKDKKNGKNSKNR